MMKFLYILTFFICSLSVCGQSNNNDKKRDVAFYNAISKWFSAWKLVSKDMYKIEKVRPVEFVFFDDKYVYSTSTITIKNGHNVKGKNLMNLKFHWKKKLHNDSLTLPDKSVVPINLMSFAAEIPTDSGKSFFVMPLPSFWKKSEVSSKELGLENLITGVFIHEFSHSQQMQNFGKKMTDFEKENNFGVQFSDDIVQDIYGKDTTYLEFYKKEIELFYTSINNNVLEKKSFNEGFAIMKKRQKEYFKGKYENLNQVDNFFLTMEGLGQYSMFLWLTHPKGGNIKREIAIKGVRRGGKWWSQDEGFALFLILDNLIPLKNWIQGMFGEKTESVVNLIDNNL